MHPITVHASCVALQGKAALILGASGSGKSTLALELMSRGAQLVADDQTQLLLKGDTLIASAPDAIKGKIEARGIGILNADPAPETPVKLVIDLDQTEDHRLPQWHTIARFGVTLPLLFNVPHPHFAPAILQYLSHGRSE
ncbi:MAG: HPr kinase/phosphorylase [Cognatishimia sp.]